MIKNLHSPKNHNERFFCKAIMVASQKRSFTAAANLLVLKCFIAVAILTGLLFPLNKSIAQAPIITTSVGMPTGNASCYGVAYGNSVYVSILFDGKIFTSTTGLSWTKQTDASIPTGKFNKICFGNGYFVIVGNAGLIITSTDGITWTSRTSNTTENLYDVQYLESNYYIVGNKGIIRKASAVTTWVTVTLNAGLAADDLRSISFGNGKYVIGVGFNTTANSGAILRSTTGASNSWTFQGVHPGSFLNKAQYIKDRFYLFFSGSYIYTSTDATTWTNASITLTLPNSTTGSWDASHQISNGLYDGTRFIFFGQGSYFGYGSVFTSTNGTSITLQNKTAHITCNGSAYLNGKYFQHGNEGIVSSTDGINYQYPTCSYTGLASDGSSYVGVGAVGQTGLIFSSTDFSNMTSKSQIGTKGVNAVTYTGTKYVAIGDQIVLESTNSGTTWTQISTPTDNYTGIAYGSGKYVAIGIKKSDNSNLISYSSDGISWTTANTENISYFKVKYLNGQFFALGVSGITGLGAVMHSADGITFTEITPNLTFDCAYYNDVVFDGAKYHFMGMAFLDAANYIYDGFFNISSATVTNRNSYSNRGSITTPPTGVILGGSWGEGAFAYSNGRFAGVVNDISTYQTYVIYSQDGINWTDSALNETGVVTGAVAAGNTFRFAGYGDTKISVIFAGNVLPVSILQLKGSNSNNTTNLSWKTENEQNTQSFAIEYSTNGTKWQTVGNIAAAGNSNKTSVYYFNHNAAGNINKYYRVVLNDADGQLKYSNIINLKSSNLATGVYAYPNPTRSGSFTLQLKQAVSIQLYNSNGLMVMQKQLKEGTQQLNVQGMAKGVYTLKAGIETIQLMIE
jgi:hypothetical protein